MNKQQTDLPLYSEELEQLNFDQNEEEVRELFERKNLPTPSELEKYDRLMPNGAERVFNLIEDEKMREYELELKQISGRNRLNQLISASGLVLGILLLFTVMTNPYGAVNSGFLFICAVIVLILIIAPLYWSRISDKS